MKPAQSLSSRTLTYIQFGLVLGVVSTIVGIWSAFAQTDKLLVEIRDVLIEIRDRI